MAKQECYVVVSFQDGTVEADEHASLDSAVEAIEAHMSDGVDKDNIALIRGEVIGFKIGGVVLDEPVKPRRKRAAPETADGEQPKQRRRRRSKEEIAAAAANGVEA